MENLIPGITYVYERSNSKIYAREFGSSERKIIGIDSKQFKSFHDRCFTTWNDVLLEAEHNVALQNALSSAIMLYRLSKDDPK